MAFCSDAATPACPVLTGGNTLLGAIPAWPVVTGAPTAGYDLLGAAIPAWPVGDTGRRAAGYDCSGAAIPAWPVVTGRRPETLSSRPAWSVVIGAGVVGHDLLAGSAWP